MAQRDLKPIQAKATFNARQLSEKSSSEFSGQCCRSSRNVLLRGMPLPVYVLHCSTPPYTLFIAHHKVPDELCDMPPVVSSTLQIGGFGPELQHSGFFYGQLSRVNVASRPSHGERTVRPAWLTLNSSRLRVLKSFIRHGTNAM
jgi:hypothetical protein